MKVLIPLAGLGTRVRPHTYSKPKCLINVAGKPVLAHILDELAVLPVEEIIFITGQLSEQIEHYIAEYYPQYPVRYLNQAVMSGQSQAIYMAREFVQDSELLVIFSDTIFKTDLATLVDEPGDGVLHVKFVDDPDRFGVAVLNEAGQVTRLVEKPVTPVSNLAVVGVYYFKHPRKLFEAIEGQIRSGLQLGGEYYLADAIELLIKEGGVFHARPIELWEDCGTIPALLESNRRLLAMRFREVSSEPLVAGEVLNSVIIPPVYLAPGSLILNSVIGPNVSVSREAQIKESVVRESLIGEHASVVGANLAFSVVGSRARVIRNASHLNIGDSSEVLES